MDATKRSGRRTSAAHLTRERVSACLIVQDEQERLSGALESVGFCDEVIVVDGGSHDRSVELARAAGAKVIEKPWPGFAAQRNVALDHASGDWVLEIDADERVSPQLRDSIERLLAAPPAAQITICALRNTFLGRRLGPSAKYPAYRSRLFRRGAYRHDETRAVHEGIEPRERPAMLAGDLDHELATTIHEALVDAWRYARLESRHLDSPGNPLAYLKGIVLRPAAKTLYRVLVDGGWRDGWRGLFKILLDAGSDALVWLLVLARRDTRHIDASNRAARSADTERAVADWEDGAQRAPETRHFGRRPTGMPKVVAVAGRGERARAAIKWLSELRAHGVDVALISSEHEDSEQVPAHRLDRVSPLALMRAIDLEMQIRTIGAVVPFGRWARINVRLLPATLRPEIAGLHAGLDPDLAASALASDGAAAPMSTNG
jgi:glycosyltransferase involved in cell wall biosynthesis